MKKLTISRRIIFALFAVLFGVNLWGQSLTLLDPESPNSESNPYLIGSAADWTKFATNSDYWDGYVKLTQNIEVTNMVGYENDEESFITKENFDLVISDESHMVSQPQAMRTKIFNDIAKKIL